MSTRYLVGVDDTDNLESRGTGHRARQLGDLLGRSGMHLRGVTRHQLFVSPAIPYTSHNSAACLDVQSADESPTRLIGLCRDFVRADSAPGSDAGICIAVASSVAPAVADFGARAKHLVLDMTEAETLARQNQMHLEPLTGTGLGIIGALAAVGLRAAAGDGRFLWLPGLRELTGVHQAALLRERLDLDAVETEAGTVVDDRDRVQVGEWPRPLLRAGRRVFLVEESGHEDVRWVGLNRERLKQLSG